MNAHARARRPVPTALVAVSVIAGCATLAGCAEPGVDGVAPGAEPTEQVAQGTTCAPRVEVYPVRGRHNHGYDSQAGNTSLWTCDADRSNSDFVASGPDYHNGNDVWAAEGTPVAATVTGTVRAVGDASGIGNRVTISDACGWWHLSGHLQRIAPGITNGMRITAGTIIGYVGRTGSRSGGVVHLHYTLYPDGVYDRGVDPWPYLRRVESDVCGPPAPPVVPCNGTTAEPDSCAVEMLTRNAGSYAPPRTTDLDADGRADVCGRGIAGVMCFVARDGARFDPLPVVPWSDAMGWNAASRYATIRMGDVDGDRRADLCTRTAARFECRRATGDATGFAPEPIGGPAMTDASGWNAPGWYTTIRLADFTGDGRDDVCARTAAGFRCWPAMEAGGFGAEVVGPEWSDANSFNSPKYYGTIRMGDVNGDGRADACVRHNAAFSCWLSDGAGFPTRVDGPGWSDTAGWSARQYWSTITLADVNGDRRADVCGRGAMGLYCALATEGGFAEPVLLAALSDANGWSDPANFETLRAGDLDGDGAQEICARANAAVNCYRWNGSGADTIAGPAWSDAAGWGAAQHYSTIALGDGDGDGRDELCGRDAMGWHCRAYTAGTGFGEPVRVNEFASATGWDAVQHYSTLRFGGPIRRDATPGGDGGVVGDGGGADAGTPPAGSDGGATRDARASDAGAGDGGMGAMPPGCACRAAGAGAPGGDGRSRGAWVLAALAMASVVARARRRASRLERRG